MYAFSRVKPPLLRDFPDVRGIDPAVLRESVKSAQFETLDDRRTSEMVLSWLQTRSLYELSRTVFWTIIEGPIRYANDLKLTVKTTTGYTETQKSKFEAMLDIGGTSTSGPPIAQLKLEVKLQLKISEETERQWRSEVTTTAEQTFQAEHTYVTWQLIDSVSVKRTIERKRLLGTNRVVIGVDPLVVTEERVDCVLATYQDKLPDTGLPARTLSTLLANSPLHQ